MGSGPISDVAVTDFGQTVRLGNYGGATTGCQLDDGCAEGF
jgi:hypothetical protein